MQAAQPDPLSELRDIHLPSAVEAWPPALGWWGVALVLTACLIGLILWLRGRWRKTAYRREALREVKTIEERFKQDADSRTALLQLQQLMKRTAIAGYSRVSVAALSGVAWTHFLDATGATSDFSLGAGELLIDGPYKPVHTLEVPKVTALIKLCSHWIKQHDPQAALPTWTTAS